MFKQFRTSTNGKITRNRPMPRKCRKLRKAYTMKIQKVSTTLSMTRQYPGKRQNPCLTSDQVIKMATEMKDLPEVK